MGDTVSVIIPAYNAASYIERAVNSALEQSRAPLEVIVVDDGSQDRTAEVVSRFPAPVRLIRKPNGGPASARNLGARHAQGAWLALLDADDWWMPDKLQVQLCHAADLSVGVIHCLPGHQVTTVPDKLSFRNMWERNWIINSSVLIRRQAFEELGGFNEAPDLISVEDYNLWVRIAASRWQIITCQHRLVHYSRGIGISANSERLLRASLVNIADLGCRMGLPDDIVRAKRNQVLAEFGRRALFERNLPAARRLLRQAFSDTWAPRQGLDLLVSHIPQPILDLRRTVGGMVTRNRVQESSPQLPAVSPDVARSWPVPIVRSQRPDEIEQTRLPRPILVTTVDAEEDFDWTRPFSRASTNVTSMRSQHLAHRVFENYGIIPAYMVDFPVASQPDGRAPLQELLRSGLCDIGAQLHPWVTPPFIEHVTSRNSYAGNLPALVERAKIEALTRELEAAFAQRPGFFRAGRYGVGPNTGSILRDCHYEADSSVVPCWNFSLQGGPDFRGMTAHPYWVDRIGGILELPVAAAIVGHGAALPTRVTTRMVGSSAARVGAPSVLSRLGLLERIKLTPEGIAIDEAKRLVRSMIATGHRVFVLTYHSPSLEPGNTPYVRTLTERDAFLGWLDEFYDFFRTEVGGAFARWSEARSTMMARSATTEQEKVG